MATINEGTIGETIRRLARESGAPASFVDQVREFFYAKRVPLHECVDPYLAALKEVFLLEETVRRGTLEARENLIRLQDCLRLVGSTYQQQLGQLRRVRDSLDQQGRLVREGAQRLRDLARGAQQRPKQQSRTVWSVPDGVFLVPGPIEPQ